MANTIYSHAFLVGNFNGELKPEQLDPNVWKQEIISLNGEEPRYERDGGYNGLCTLYYKAHLDAMIEGKDVKKPDFLNSVHHYVHNLGHIKSGDINHNKITLPFSKGKYPNYTPYDYTFKICKLHLYFFPLDIILFAIEIDDTGTELDNLTAAHGKLMTQWNADSFDNEKLANAMLPITNYLSKNSTKKLTKDGNKLKLFQTIKIETKEIKNDLLYEMGTSSPIGCVKNGSRPDLKPSETYFNMIMEQNIVSTFDNWKGLALVDSFTILGMPESFNENDCNFLYFPLIYLRCLFEKTFCFSRNNAYREDKADLKNLPLEIEQMEKYYFYDNLSYNFQPNLLYKAMAKGLSIKEEREELIKQVKESAKKEAQERKERQEEQKEKEEKRLNNILAYVSIFAVFSVIWDTYSIAKEAFSISLFYEADVSLGFICLGFVVIIFLLYQIYKKDINIWAKKNILRRKSI